MGKTRKVGGAGKSNPPLRSFLPFNFRVRAFLIQRTRLSWRLEQASNWALTVLSIPFAFYKAAYCE